MDDAIESSNTRTGAPRKIDEWTAALPGGAKASFIVSMKYEHGMCIFSLKSDHPDFSTMDLFSSDLNELRSILNAYVHQVIEDSLSKGWTPASILEVRHGLNAGIGRGDSKFSLSINIKRVERLDVRHVGNFPTVTVRDKYRQETLALRAHSEDFTAIKPKSGRLTDPEVKDWLSNPASRDPATGLGRSVINGDGLSEGELLSVLEIFSKRLAGRLAQGRVDVEGMPGGLDMVEMMREAVG